MANNEQNERHPFHAVSGFRTSIPPDRPDLLLFELKDIRRRHIAFFDDEESALIFGQEVGKAAAN